VIASESLSAIRKDVLAKCYGKTSCKPGGILNNFNRGYFQLIFIKKLFIYLEKKISSSHVDIYYLEKNNKCMH